MHKLLHFLYFHSIICLMNSEELNPTPEIPLVDRAITAIVGFFALFTEVDPNIREAGLREQGLAQAREDLQHRKSIQ